MNIAFDIDGVLTDFEYFLNCFGGKYLSKKLKKDMQPVQPSSSIAKRFDCSEAYNRKFYSRYLYWYTKKYPIRENAAETIRALKEKGHKIYIITARALASRTDLLGNRMRHNVEKWLKKNGVDYDGIYYVSVENSAKEKSDIARKIGIDYFVEDEPTNIEELKKLCPVICLDADYNQKVSGCFHALDFGEIYRIIESGQEIRNGQQYCVDEPFDADIISKSQKKCLFYLKTIGVILQCIYKIDMVKNLSKQTEKPAIYVCNHRRSMDIPICYILLRDKFARFLIKKEYMFSIFGTIQREIGTIYVERENKLSGRRAKKTMIQTIFNGCNILLFPEGTRNRTEQVLLPFKKGAVSIAQVTGAPIIPIVIHKEGRKFKVTIGEAMLVGREDSLEEKNNYLRERMAKMYEGM